MIAFAYYGGKQRLAADLIALMPPHHHYCEPFAGSLAVLLNKKPSLIETANDLNSDVVNFFRVLRDQPEQLVRALTLTPYARAEFYEAWEPATDPVERARRFYLAIQMDFAKAGRRSDRCWMTSKTFSKGQFNYKAVDFYKKIDGLEEVAERLKHVQFDNRPAVEVIAACDTPETFFYCDPPYVFESRSTGGSDYALEMRTVDHTTLAEQLRGVQGKVMLSGYESDLYLDLYRGWYKTVFSERTLPMSRTKTRRTREVVWTNYDPRALHGQQVLFTDEKLLSHAG